MRGSKVLNYALVILIFTLLPSFAQAADEGANDSPKPSPMLEDLKRASEEFKKRLTLRNEVKLYNVSISTGYSDSKDHETATDGSGKTLSISISRKLSRIEQVSVFGFGSQSRTTTSDNQFGAQSRGLGLGYSNRSIGGITFGGSFSFAHSSSDSVIVPKVAKFPTQSEQVIPGSSQSSYSLSVYAFKAHPLSGGYTATPLLNLHYTYNPDNKPTTILSPTLNLSKSFSENWLGNVSIGGNISQQDITLSGKKASLEAGLGLGYVFQNRVQLKADYKRQQSSGHHSDSLSLSTSLPF